MKSLLQRAAIVLGADLVFLAVLPQLSASMRVATMLGVIIAGPAATIVAMELLEPPSVRRRSIRWAIRLGAFAVGLPILVRLQGTLTFGDASRWMWVRSGALLVSIALVLFALFRTAAELIGASFRLLPSLRSRFVVLCMLSGVLARMLSVNVGGEGWEGKVGVYLVVATIILGFAAAASIELTESLNQAIAALQRLGSGDLSVQLPIRGRDEVSEVARAFNGTVAQLRDKEFVERAFGRYASPDVLRALKDGGGLQLAPERREATVLFADIRGFTAMSETATPEVVLGILNAYFARVVEVVGAHGGYINKFIGDAIMVVFNAPSLQPDHAARGVDCARAIQDAVEALNAAHAFGERTLQVGVGVNTGALVAGSLGGEARAEYTVIGDTVNVASRLTSAARPGQVLVGARTASEANRSGLTALAPITVKGKIEPLPVFQAR